MNFSHDGDAAHRQLALIDIEALFRDKTSPLLYLAIAIAAVGIFIADLAIPLGIAVWVLYFIPIALSNFAWRPRAPLVIAALASSFLIAGFFFSPGIIPGASFVVMNRSFAFITMWVAAIIGRRFILNRLEVRRQDWIRTTQAGLATQMLGEQTHTQLGENVLAFVAQHLAAKVGAIYLVDSSNKLRRFAGYALDPAASAPAVIAAGEGLVGQVLRDQRLLQVHNVPEKYLNVRSSLGTHPPRNLLIAPAVIDEEVHCVIELGFFRDIDDTMTALLEQISTAIASAVRSVTFRMRQRELLEETQRQAEELQTQQEELRVQNEELEQQSRAMQESQTRLEHQQAELEQINSQLEEQTQALEHQRDDLAAAQSNLNRASAYKSEFLANMSHELRTPLNSSLILAKLLADNRDANLTPEQVKFAQTIYQAGNDLLTLINDILDLSKIEAGKMDVRPETVPLKRLVEDLTSTFTPVAGSKHLDLQMTIAEGLPDTIYTDPMRLLQILRNLLSNALKFTEKGSVFLTIGRAPWGKLAFAVRDTGIGIPLGEHEVIFEAFRQADGTTSRKHGGTGLGLSISRDLARLLGGELTVESAPGRGSTFTVTVPESYVAREESRASHEAAIARFRPDSEWSAAPSATSLGNVSGSINVKKILPPPSFPDDRERIQATSRSLLVIEDDINFARILYDLAHELDFLALVAQNAEDGLELAERYRPSAIVLDVGLPDRSGLSVLDALKHSAATRHIPVHMLSVADHTQTALEMGAAGYATKPIKREDLVEALQRLEAKFTQKLRRVLVVEDNELHRESTCKLLATDDVETIAVGTAREALNELGKSTFDCMVLDLSLPDQTGFDLLEEMSQHSQYSFPPVIVYTGRSLSHDEEHQLRKFSSSIIIKGARSPERLLDELTLFLHQVESDLPADRQRMLRDARHREALFEGRRVLVVEDDVRNIFALASVLEPKGAKVEIARNGLEALKRLKEAPGVDLILMDIMMPVMDGLVATREIRKLPEHAKVPIIALTAKAMADDREACLGAGANDYIAKPIDIDKLLSLARVWMPK